MMTHLDILVLLVVVVLIFQRLRSLLGTRPPVEERKIRLSKENAEKLYNILMTEASSQSAEKEQPQPQEELVPEGDLSEPEKTLREIPNFNKSAFLKSAEKAFQIITEAFNKGDTETLEMLVNKKIFKKFQDVIEKRKNEGISAETDFICFDKVEIVAAQITTQKNAQISVEFVSEQVNVLRNSDDEVIEGDENYIQNITDVWTFEKALNSTSPNWLLISTKKS